MNRRDALALLTSLPAVGSIARADVKPHSVIVITCPGAVSKETAAHIMKAAKKIWPNHQCAVLSDGMTLQVLDEAP